MTNAEGPLAGIRVLDLTRYQQGPYATSLLADLGAEVIKVEGRPDGEFGRQTERDEHGFSPYFETYNRGKRSLTLDLKQPRAIEVILRLLERCDVLVENFRPGVMERLGLGYEAMHARFPRLVYGSASAFGPRGPEAERPGFDHIAQAISGFMIEVAGGPGNEPQPGLPGMADQVSAVMFAFGIVSAIVARDRMGEGQHIDVSLLGSMIALQGRQLLRYLKTGKQGRRHWRRSAVYTHYRAADGWVAIAAQDPHRWAPLCRALGRPDLINDERFKGPWERSRHDDELVVLLEWTFAERPVAHWLEALREQDVPCGPVADFRDLEQNPQLLANDYIVTVEHPSLGELRTPGIPLHFSGTPAPPLRPAPELGQDSEMLLLDLGYSWDEIGRLRADDVI